LYPFSIEFLKKPYLKDFCSLERNIYEPLVYRTGEGLLRHFLFNVPHGVEPGSWYEPLVIKKFFKESNIEKIIEELKVNWRFLFEFAEMDLNF